MAIDAAGPAGSAMSLYDTASWTRATENRLHGCNHRW
jgi:hypothetical protein